LIYIVKYVPFFYYDSYRKLLITAMYLDIRTFLEIENITSVILLYDSTLWNY